MLYLFYRCALWLVFVSLMGMVALAGLYGSSLLFSLPGSMFDDIIQGLIVLFPLALCAGLFLIALQLAGARPALAEPVKNRRNGWPLYAPGIALLLGVVSGAGLWASRNEPGASPDLVVSEENYQAEARKHYEDALYHKSLLQGLLPMRQDADFVRRASQAAELIQGSIVDARVRLLFSCERLGQRSLCAVDSRTQDLLPDSPRRANNVGEGFSLSGIPNAKPGRPKILPLPVQGLLDDKQLLGLVQPLQPGERRRVDSLLHGQLSQDTLQFRRSYGDVALYMRLVKDSQALVFYIESM